MTLLTFANHWLLRLCAGLLALASASCSQEDPAKRCNVLLITLDTTRVDAIGCFGGPVGVTPTIDAFAQEGVRFESTYTPAPLTLPAHSSLLTGRYPDENGVRANSSYALPSKEWTLAEILEQEGYDTAAFVASYVLNAQYGLAQGFEHYDDEVTTTDGAHVAERPANEVVDSLLGWLKGRDTEKPFFTWLHCYDPHYPHELQPGQGARFDKIYHDEVAFVDSQLARLRLFLEETGQLADTLVIITSDHGEGQGEHGEGTHGYLLYQGTQHIPLLISHPSLPQGEVVKSIASLVDVLPTTLGFLGLDTGSFSGIDLFGDNPSAERILYMEAELGRIDFGLSPLSAAVDSTYKWIAAPAPELYKLASDPGEHSNLATTQTRRANELQAWLDARGAGVHAGLKDQSDSVSKDLMRGLGYSGGASDTEVTRTEWTPDLLIRWSELSNTGNRHYQAGDLQMAIKFLRPLVKECPDSHSAQLFLGLSLARSGDIEKGLIHLHHAVRLQPDASADAWWNIAVGRALSGKRARAWEALKQVIQLEPTHIRALQKLAELNLQDDRTEEARRHLDTLVLHAPDSKEGRWAKAQLRQMQ